MANLVSPPPIQEPIFDRNGRPTAVWAAWFRDMYKRVGGSVAPETVEEHIADTTNAHAASAIGFSPTGSIAASNVQSAVAEVASEAQSGISAHTGAASGAHAASAISNTPSGNLAAANVQSALNELQSDIDTRAMNADLLTHTGAASGAHAASAISNSPSGNLAATDVQGALDELQADVDTRAILPSQAGNSGKYLMTDGSVTRWDKPTGSGGGGVNFLGLNSTWQTTNPDDRDCETSVGSVAVYADAAGTSPVDMTGGAPLSTIDRITAGHLNGLASWKFDLGTGASRQGEGFSWPTVYVPEGYRGQSLAFTGQWEATGTLAEDDLKLYAYDVTNSELITPTSYRKIIGSRGAWCATFPVKTTTAQIRVGMHVARTSTAALSLVFDDVSVSPAVPVLGAALGDWQRFPPIGSWTGNATYSGQWRQVGSDAEFKVSVMTTGAPTPSSTGLQITLPFTVDTAKMQLGAQSVGIIGKGVARQFGSTSYPLHVYYGGASVVGISASQATTTNLSKSSSDDVKATVPFSFASGDGLMVEFKVPILGWSSNVQMGESSVKRISSYLANGTRVTTTPTKLGEYRTRYRASATSSTLTDTAPSVAPTSTDGMRIYGNVAWNVGGTSGQPTLYDVFVGKNKYVGVNFAMSAAFTDAINTNYYRSDSNEFGALTTYDPKTGVVTVNAAHTESSANTGRYLGRKTSDSTTTVSNGYFDITVSDNPLFVGSQQPRSEIYVTKGNGFGSSATKIRRFVNLEKSTGTALTYTDSSILGASFVINEDGVYAISYADLTTGSAASSAWGVSVDSNQLSTNLGLISNQNRLAFLHNPGSDVNAVTSVTTYLEAGRVIRPHTHGVLPAAENEVFTSFRITKVSN